MRTLPAVSTIVLLAGASTASGGTVAFSNFASFSGNPGTQAQASAVTAANAPIVSPFASNTASMRVALGADASVNALRVLTPTAFLPDSGPAPANTGFEVGGATDGDGRTGPAVARDPASLAPLRVSIYANAADVESRAAFASVDFGAGEYGFEAWSVNGAFFDLSFDLGPTLSLGAGEWFVEVAQIDPAGAAFFLAMGAGDGMHLFDPVTGDLGATGHDFALELGLRGVTVPLPTGGALALAGLGMLGARRRR